MVGLLLVGALCGVSHGQMNSDAPGGLYHRSAVEKGVGTMEAVRITASLPYKSPSTATGVHV